MSPLSLPISILSRQTFLTSLIKLRFSLWIKMPPFNNHFLTFTLFREYQRGKYHCTVDLLFDWFGLVCFANKIVSCHTADSKQVKQEVNSTVILPPLVFPALFKQCHLFCINNCLWPNISVTNWTFWSFTLLKVWASVIVQLALRFGH
jgi:hypothetical protein